LPQLVAADAGFYSLANEQGAQAEGVKYVSVPNCRTAVNKAKVAKGALVHARAQQWRTGSKDESANQRSETTTRIFALLLLRNAGNVAVDRGWHHCRQPDQYHAIPGLAPSMHVMPLGDFTQGVQSGWISSPNHPGTMQGLLVVAADAVSTMFFRLFDRLGIPGNDLRRTIRVLKGGAREGCRSPTARARLERCRQANSAGEAGALRNDKWLARAMKIALEEAGIERRDVDFCYGLGRGLAPYDQLEI